MYDWPAIKERYIRGESPTELTRSLGGRPARGSIAKRVKTERWDLLRKKRQGSSPNERKIVLQAFRDGANQKLAAQLAGVARQTVANWRKDDILYNAECERAEAEFAGENLGRLVVAAREGDTGLSKWFVEKHPVTKETYGQVENAGSGMQLNFQIIRDPALLDVTPVRKVIEQD